MRLAWLVFCACAASPCLAQGDEWEQQYRDGERLLQEGRAEEARRDLTAALKQAEKTGPADPRLGATLALLGQAEFRLGRFRTAAGYLERSLEVWNKSKGPLSTDVAVARSNLGQARQALGQYGRAEALFRQALARFESLGPAGRAQAAEVLSGLAEALYRQKRYPDAETSQKKALAITPATDQSQTARALNNLALIYAVQWRDREALPLLERAVALWERDSNRGLEYARGVANLGSLYRELGQPSEGEMCFRKALTAMEESVGPQHPDVGLLLNEYAALLKKKGDGRQARTMALRAQSIRSASGGEGRLGITVDWMDLRRGR